MILKQEKKKPKVVIVNDTKPKRPNRPPPPIPENVKPFEPKQTVKLRIKQKVVDNRPGWVRSPRTNGWIKIDGPTYRKINPIQNRPGWVRSPRTNRSIKIDGPTFRKSYPMLNVFNEKAKEIDATTKSIEERYRYMYLKTYAKFTFCKKSQRHVSDENFLYYCIHLAGTISSCSV